MLRFTRHIARDPRRLLGLLWPLALLAPFVPGLPRPAVSGQTWRQELVISALAFVTMLALRRRAAREGAALISRFRLTLFAPLAAFVLWAAVSVLWAANGYAAFYYALTWGIYLVFFVLLTRAAASGRVLRTSLAVLCGVVLVVGAANVIGHLGSPDSLLRRNGLGEPVAVCIPLVAALALRVRRKGAALLCGATALVAWLAVVQIAERASFVAVCAGLLVVACLSAACRRFRPRGVARAGLLAFGFAACVALQAVPSPFAESWHQPVFARLTETTVAEKNTQARFLYWAAALEMWRARPLAGVGAGGYDAALPAARAALAAKNPDSPFVELNDKFVSTGTHNEYLQILSELGAVGFALFVCFAAALMWAAARALRRSSSPLAPGAVGALAVFALSSGASAVSFRWMGSGLVFFFAAALVVRLGAGGTARGGRVSRGSTSSSSAVFASPVFARRAYGAGLAFSLVVALAVCAQAANVFLLAGAQASGDNERAERLFRAAYRLNPFDAATRYSYGMWLSNQHRGREAAPHLAHAVARGFSAVTCYAYLASAEEAAGDREAAERTLAEAVRVYPRSVFLRVRHAAALERAGRAAEAASEMERALALNAYMARGWQQLIYHDIDAAIAAARADSKHIALPGQLYPEDAVFAVLHENERRFPAAVNTGWRARARKAFTD